MLALILFSAMLVMLFAPETPIGKALHSALVAWPARQLSRISRGQMIIAVAAVVVIVLSVTIFGHDAAILLRLASPELLLTVANLELATYVDVVTGVAMVAMSGRFRGWAAAMRGSIRRVARLLGQRPRPRAPHNHRPSKPDLQGEDGANDNDDDRTGVWAAA